jgi:hypothetical protein
MTMDSRYEESHPRSPFALNVVTVIVYVAAAVVVTCWFAMVLAQAEKF